MKPVRSLIITGNPDFATLWLEEAELGHAVAVLTPHDSVIAALWGARLPTMYLPRTPAEALSWAPDVVITDDPSMVKVTRLFSEQGIPVVNASLFLRDLAQDPEVSRNAISTLFNPTTSRRFIPLHPIPGMVQMEALYFSLRYPEDRYILDIGDTRDALICVTAKEVLDNLDAFQSVVAKSASLYCNRANGLIAHRDRSPVMLFSISGIFGGTWLGSPIVMWQDGLDKVVAFLPFQFEGLERVTKLCESYKVRGAITLQCCMDPQEGIQVYRIDPGMPLAAMVWLRCALSPDQSWADLWRSVAKGNRFDYRVKPVLANWVLEMDRDAGLNVQEGQCAYLWSGFTRDYLVGNTIWAPPHFDLTQFSSLEIVIQSGLLEKKPLWAALELSRVEQFLKVWVAPMPEAETPLIFPKPEVQTPERAQPELEEIKEEIPDAIQLTH